MKVKHVMFVIMIILMGCEPRMHLKVTSYENASTEFKMSGSNYNYILDVRFMKINEDEYLLDIDHPSSDIMDPMLIKLCKNNNDLESIRQATEKANGYIEDDDKIEIRLIGWMPYDEVDDWVYGVEQYGFIYSVMNGKWTDASCVSSRPEHKENAKWAVDRIEIWKKHDPDDLWTIRCVMGEYVKRLKFAYGEAPVEMKQDYPENMMAPREVQDGEVICVWATVQYDWLVPSTITFYFKYRIKGKEWVLIGT